MKTNRSNMWIAVCAALLSGSAAFRASADESAAAAANRSEKSYTGTVVSVDPNEHVLNVKGWTMMTKAFNLGGTCFISQLGKDNATANDVRAGEKVSVSYQNVHGVLIASRVEQEPMRFEGTVKEINNDTHTLTLHRTALDKDVQFPTDCRIVLRDGRTGAPADIQLGYHVTVTYEMPGGVPTAREIAQTSIPFTGTLTAIDLNDNTVKAKAAFDSKKFVLADNCAIVINGRADGKLAELKPNDKLLFSYDEINGVNVVNRIGPANLPANSVAGNTPNPMTGY